MRGVGLRNTRLRKAILNAHFFFDLLTSHATGPLIGGSVVT
jgi:hypothetical protein